MRDLHEVDSVDVAHGKRCESRLSCVRELDVVLRAPQTEAFNSATAKKPIEGDERTDSVRPDSLRANLGTVIALRHVKD
jgi:hypothetical protein